MNHRHDDNYISKYVIVQRVCLRILHQRTLILLFTQQFFRQ